MSASSHISNSAGLSGTKALAKDDSDGSVPGEYQVFRSATLREHWSAKEGTRIATEEDCRMAMVLLALLAGGDYAPEGLVRCGKFDFVFQSLFVTNTRLYHRSGFGPRWTRQRVEAVEDRPGRLRSRNKTSPITDGRRAAQ